MYPSVFQAVIEEIKYLYLQGPVKIYKHVAAQNKLEFIERVVRYKVVGRKNNFTF